MVRNTPKHVFRVQWGGSGAFVAKNSDTSLCHELLHANAPKWYEMHQNTSLGSNGVDRVGSLRKILMRLRGTNFCTTSARFAQSFARQLNGPECTQIERNAPKRHFRVQRGGSGAFVAKNSDTTSWHEHFAMKAPYPPHWNLNSCFGAFRTIGCIRCKKF